MLSYPSGPPGDALPNWPPVAKVRSIPWISWWIPEVGLEVPCVRPADEHAGDAVAVKVGPLVAGAGEACGVPEVGLSL